MPHSPADEKWPRGLSPRGDDRFCPIDQHSRRARLVSVSVGASDGSADSSRSHRHGHQSSNTAAVDGRRRGRRGIRVGFALRRQRRTRRARRFRAARRAGPDRARPDPAPLAGGRNPRPARGGHDVGRAVAAGRAQPGSGLRAGLRDRRVRAPPELADRLVAGRVREVDGSRGQRCLRTCRRLHAATGHTRGAGIRDHDRRQPGPGDRRHRHRPRRVPQERPESHLGDPPWRHRHRSGRPAGRLAPGRPRHRRRREGRSRVVQERGIRGEGRTGGPGPRGGARHRQPPEGDPQLVAVRRPPLPLRRVGWRPRRAQLRLRRRRERRLHHRPRLALLGADVGAAARPARPVRRRRRRRPRRGGPGHHRPPPRPGRSGAQRADRRQVDAGPATWTSASRAGFSGSPHGATTASAS